MLFYEMTIAGLKKKLPICPLNDNLSIAGFVILGDAPLTEACARELIKKLPEYDYILTAEAKGIPLAHEIARQKGERVHFVARKGKKLYMADPIESRVRSITTDHEQVLYLDGYEAEMMRGKRILIVDDVVSTGESLLAIEKLVKDAGATVAGRVCILAEGDAAKRKDLIFLEELPLFNPDGTVKKN